eukprot:scaffold44866_cov292-Skeletonema_marinoi.AAC.4
MAQEDGAEVNYLQSSYGICGSLDLDRRRKQTTDIAKALRFHIGKANARIFYSVTWYDPGNFYCVGENASQFHNILVLGRYTIAKMSTCAEHATDTFLTTSARKTS